MCVARIAGDPRRRKVALKILKGAYTRNPKILNRTRDEARLLAHINHPNVVRVERLIEIGGRPVVVMELVEGVSLDQLLLRFKQGLPAAVAIEVVRQTLIALHVAYYEATGPDDRPLKVIHRDIKPSNIMLSTAGDVKVGDFGIAKGDFSGREAQTESVVLGSRPYMAPERLDGITDSPTVDVYSSGMSLYELLTGRTMSLSINPVTHEQAMNRQLGYLHVEGMTESGLEDLRGIIRRMCAYDRDYRPGSLEAARELEQCLYSIDQRFRLELEEFARTTVLPIYESRPRIAPEEAVQDESESEFIREVTGQVTSPTITVGKTESWTPYIFVTALSMLVAILGTLAVYKFISDSEPRAPATPMNDSAPLPTEARPVDAPGATDAAGGAAVAPVNARPQEAPPKAAPKPPAPAPHPAPGAVTSPVLPDVAPTPPAQVKIEVHPPPDARVQIGETSVRSPAYVQIAPGENTALVTFADRTTITCPFTAAQADIVRLVDGLEGRRMHVSGQPQPLCTAADR